MQTFLPYDNFTKSAEVLDNRRLNKQLVECSQILNTLMGFNISWRNHPAVKMWRGHEEALALYAREIYWEYRKRFGNKTHKSWERIKELVPERKLSSVILPDWIDDQRVFDSHKSNLYRKDPVHYKQFSSYGPNLPYFWPV